MKLPLPQPRTRILVVGKTGTGKSTRVKDAVREWLRAGVRVVALDCCDEYSQAGRETGLVRLGPLRERCTASQLAASPRRLEAQRLSLAVVPDDKTPASWARAFSLVVQLLRAIGRPTLVVLDEVGTWTDASFGPACARARAELAALANNGRHDGLALVLVSQRAAQVPPPARAQSTDIWAFLQDNPADVDALAERIGKDSAERCSRLALGESVDWRDTPTPTAKKATTEGTLQ